MRGELPPWESGGKLFLIKNNLKVNCQKTKLSFSKLSLIAKKEGQRTVKYELLKLPFLRLLRCWVFLLRYRDDS